MYQTYIYYNFSLQSNKFDKDCIYIKRWLPQLGDINPKHLHDWEKYSNLYDMHKINYCKPIIDYKKSKKESLILYKKIFMS